MDATLEKPNEIGGIEDNMAKLRCAIEEAGRRNRYLRVPRSGYAVGTFAL